MKIILSGYGKIGKLLGERLSSNELLILDPKYSLVKIENVYDDYDYIIDFSTHEAIYGIYEYLLKHKRTKLIIGTTSFNDEENRLIEEISLDHVVIKDSNFSFSMMIFKKIVSYLNHFNLSSFQISLKETHNISKKDSPSGTTLDLVKRLYKSYVVITSKRNNTKKCGVHEITLKENNGMIKLVHQAEDRMMFVDGVIRALELSKNLEFGLYSFEDLLDDK